MSFTHLLRFCILLYCLTLITIHFNACAADDLLQRCSCKLSPFFVKCFIFCDDRARLTLHRQYSLSLSCSTHFSKQTTTTKVREKCVRVRASLFHRDSRVSTYPIPNKTDWHLKFGMPGRRQDDVAVQERRRWSIVSKSPKGLYLLGKSKCYNLCCSHFQGFY